MVGFYGGLQDEEKLILCWVSDGFNVLEGNFNCALTVRLTKK
jgi:hypothetical protein